MEAGAASAVLALSEQAGVPLAETQKKLTPFQRMVLLKEMERQQEEARNQNNTTSSPSGGLNPSGMSGGGRISGETVKYVNEGVNNDG